MGKQAVRKWGAAVVIMNFGACLAVYVQEGLPAMDGLRTKQPRSNESREKVSQVDSHEEEILWP